MAEIPGVYCPHCGADNEVSDGAEGPHQVPSPGAASICAVCRCVAIFDVDADSQLRLRKPTADELKSVMADTRVQIMFNALATHSNVYKALEATRLSIRQQAREDGNDST